MTGVQTCALPILSEQEYNTALQQQMPQAPFVNQQPNPFSNSIPIIPNSFGNSMNPMMNVIPMQPLFNPVPSINPFASQSAPFVGQSPMNPFTVNSFMNPLFTQFTGQSSATQQPVSNAPFDRIPIKTKMNGQMVNSPSSMPAVNGWSVITNPFQKNKLLAVNSATKDVFSGSGLIVFEMVNGELMINLVKSKRNVYEDFGGEISKELEVNENILKNNAIKETLEESQGVFCVDTDLNSKNGVFDRYVDIRDDNGYKYRSHFLTIEYKANAPDISKLFYQNKSRINAYGMTGNLGADWYETYQLGRFDFQALFGPISKLDENQLNSDVYICDANGQQTDMKLRSRTAKILLKLYKSGVANDMFKHITTINTHTTDVTYNSNNGISYICI